MITRTLTRRWSRYYHQIGLPIDLSKRYLTYADRLHRQGLPAIFEFAHLAKLLGRNEAYLASVVNAPQAHYRSFSIPKRRGGMRKIDAPYPLLLDCQRWIDVRILKNIPVHPAATAYVKDTSLLSNVRPHLARKCLLRIDLKDFFPSIAIRRVVAQFRRVGYAKNVAFYLAALCCLRDRLPQGAATSPALSNLVAVRMDQRLTRLSTHAGLTYTRYADDLIFSGEYIGSIFRRDISRIVEDCGFAVNKSKTALFTKPGRRIVTGVCVEGDDPRVPRGFRRGLRQELHYVMKHGLLSHISKHKIRDPFYLDSLYGRVNFWLFVEPTNEFANEAKRRLRALLANRNQS